MVAGVSSRQYGILLLLFGAVLILLAWSVAPVPSPPLYDGLQGPVEPYRYVNPPPGQQSTSHRSPSSAVASVGVTGGSSARIVLSTKEQPPQVQVTIDSGVLRVPSGVSHVTLSIRPVAPPPQRPDGPLDGNVYRIAVTTPNGSPVDLRPGQTANVFLRGTGASGIPIIEDLTGGRWRRQATLFYQSSNYFSAKISRFGSVALIIAPGAAPTSGEDKTLAYLLFGSSIAILVLASIFVVIRLVRRSPARR